MVASIWMRPFRVVRASMIYIITGITLLEPFTMNRRVAANLIKCGAIMPDHCIQFAFMPWPFYTEYFLNRVCRA